MIKRTSIVITALFLIITSLGLSMSWAKQEGSIQIKGSDTMVNLGQAWAEEFMQEHPDSMVAVTGGGSGTGISALISGSCDIAECSRAMKPTEIEAARAHGIDPKEFKVGLDGIAVVVNPKNPVDKLTIAQLRDIFTGRVTNWKDVGGQDGKIVILSREVNSGTHVFFKEHVLTQNGKQEEFAAQALLLSSSQAIADEVTHNVNAIGYYGMGYISDKQKALAVAKDEKSVYEKPSVDNVRSGVYPIARPLLMYTAGEPQGSVKVFIDFVLSSQGQKIVEQIDFVPISK